MIIDQIFENFKETREQADWSVIRYIFGISFLKRGIILACLKLEINFPCDKDRLNI